MATRLRPPRIRLPGALAMLALLPLVLSSSIELAAAAAASLLLPATHSRLEAHPDTTPGRHTLHGDSSHRHLLQFEMVVRDETPKQQMERMRSEMQLAERQRAFADEELQQERQQRQQVQKEQAGASAGAGDEEVGQREEIKFTTFLFKKLGDQTPSDKVRSFGEDGPMGVLPPVVVNEDQATAGGGGGGAMEEGENAEEPQQQQQQQSEEQSGGGGESALGEDTHVLKGCKLVTVGGRPAKNGKERYGSWTICGNGIKEGMTVFSFGLGSEYSFDLAMSERGAKVFGFDPTKTAKYIKITFKKNHGVNGYPRGFKFSQAGIGVTDGTVPFFKSSSTGVGSMSAVPLEQLAGYKDVGYFAKLQSLGTCRKQTHSPWIHILKIDAEGVEFDLCESRAFLKQLGFVTQLLFEFHDRMMAGGRRRKVRCIKKLERMGFTVVHETGGSREVTFARLGNGVVAT